MIKKNLYFKGKISTKFAKQRGWNRGRDHGEKIYISNDSMNKHCQAGDIEFTEYGHDCIGYLGQTVPKFLGRGYVKTI